MPGGEQRAGHRVPVPGGEQRAGHRVPVPGGEQRAGHRVVVPEGRSEGWAQSGSAGGESREAAEVVSVNPITRNAWKQRPLQPVAQGLPLPQPLPRKPLPGPVLQRLLLRRAGSTQGFPLRPSLWFPASGHRPHLQAESLRVLSYSRLPPLLVQPVVCVLCSLEMLLSAPPLPPPHPPLPPPHSRPSMLCQHCTPLPRDPQSSPAPGILSSPHLALSSLLPALQS